MQSKENGTPIKKTPSETKKDEKIVTSETKKVPPKPPKRVSFLSSHKEKEETKISNHIIVDQPPDTKKDHNSLSKVEKCDLSIQNNKEKFLSKEGNSRTVSSSQQLKSDFVKNSETNIQTSFSWNGQKVSISRKEQHSDIQSRLSESQSKIAKLQQSLPTKLSEATVQSLKNKYSPSNFGYPKSFTKTDKPIQSKIPALLTKSPSLIKTELKEINNTVLKTEEVVITPLNNNSIFPKKDLSKKELIKSPEKRTFKTELFITPEIEIETLPVVDTTDSSNKKETKVIKPIENLSTITAIDTKIDKVNNEKKADNFPVSKNQELVNKVIKSEILPKKQCSETILLEDDDSDTVTFSDESANSQKVNSSDFNTTDASSSNLTLTGNTSDTSEMEEGTKKPTKKRSNSFRRIFGFGSSKDKKKPDEPKPTKNGIKKKDVHSDNYENEHVFDRNAPQRHTFSGHSSNTNQEKLKPGTYGYRGTDRSYDRNTAIYVNQPNENNRVNSSLPLSMRYQYSSPNQERINERERLNMNHIQYDLYLAQQTNKRLNSSLNVPVNSTRVDEYVCMDLDKQNRNDLTQPGFINSQGVSKYIDTTSSSSTCTLESDNQNNTYENTLSRKLSQESQSDNSYNCSISRIPSLRQNSTEKKTVLTNGDKFYERPKFSNSPEMFITTPRRIQDPQLIKPKALIPINTERSLPNPYRNNKEDLSGNYTRDNVYGNIGRNMENNLNDIPRQINKEYVYGKPIPAVRKNLNIDPTFGADDDELYGTVYDSLNPVSAQLKITKTNVIKSQNKNVEKISIQNISPPRQSSMSPTNIRGSPKIEPTKLKLSPNREKMEPRLKSPIDDKLKEQAEKKKDIKKKSFDKENIPSHQNLEIEIDYPDNNINEEQSKKEHEKHVFCGDTKIESPNKEQSSPKRSIKIKRSPHVSPVRPKSSQSSPRSPQNVDTPDNSRRIYKSPVTIRTDSPASVSSSYSMKSSSSSKLPASTEDLKDLKSTEVYFWEQTNKITSTPKTKENKQDISPEQSLQQVLTQVDVHQQPPKSPRKQDNSPRVSSQNLSSGATPSSPQKQQNLKNLEAFYWQEIKRLKEKEEQEIYNNQQVKLLARNNSMNLPSAVVQQHRSRSMSPAVNRQRDKRSLSLPRDMQPQRVNADIYGYTRRQEMIPEERMHPRKVQSQYGVVRHNTNLPPTNPNFVRGSPQRSTIGSINMGQQQGDMIYENYFPGVELRHQAKSGYQPIFKRGSLTNNSRDSPPQMNKKVSFSSAQGEVSQAWPTKNGFTQSPPTRRVDKKIESLDDEVFYPNNYQNIPPALENEKNSQQQNSPNWQVQKESRYGSTQPKVTESPYGSTHSKIAESSYGTHPKMTESSYGSTHSKMVESPYDSTHPKMAESPYGSTHPKMAESSYGSTHPKMTESPYGSTHLKMAESSYGSAHPKMTESPYGSTHSKMAESPYGSTHPKMSESPYGSTHSKMTSKNEPVYESKRQTQDHVSSPNIQNYQNANIKNVDHLKKTRSASVEPIYISRKPPQYPQPEAIYVARNDQIYGRTKQVTIHNKVCDMYGQIHEQQPNIYGNIQKSGVIYGQLQQNPLPGSPVAIRNHSLNRSDPNFVRGGRLTSSFNDMMLSEAPRRPLPATPVEKNFNRGGMVMVSESESGSEAGEVQRILQNREILRRQNGYR